MKIKVRYPAQTVTVDLDTPFYYRTKLMNNTGAIVRFDGPFKTTYSGKDGTYTVESAGKPMPEINFYEHKSIISKEQFEKELKEIVGENWPI